MKGWTQPIFFCLGFAAMFLLVPSSITTRSPYPSPIGPIRPPFGGAFFYTPALRAPSSWKKQAAPITPTAPVRFNLSPIIFLASVFKALVVPLQNYVLSVENMTKLMTINQAGYYTVILHLISNILESDESLFLNVHSPSASFLIELPFLTNSTTSEVRISWIGLYFPEDTTIFVRRHIISRISQGPVWINGYAIIKQLRGHNNHDNLQTQIIK
jgi:hypothetical protein